MKTKTKLEQILEDQIDEAQNIPVWPSIEQYRNSSSGRFYRPHHDEERDFVFTDTPRYYLVRGGEGSGKGFPLDTKIPTPDGYTTIGEIKVGDKVFDEKGSICNVTEVHSIRNIDCYKIIFDTEEEIICDKDHLWSVVLRYKGKKKQKKILYTEFMYKNINKLLWKNTGKNTDYTSLSIYLSESLNLPKKELSIHPYVLGSWLGDGTSRGPQLTVGKKDQKETIKIYESFGYSLDKPSYDQIQFRINRYDNGDLLNKLRNLDLLQNKHIPIEYLRSSYKQRLLLLQGLMDTDGFVSKDGRCEFTSANKVLAEQVQELCFSLGIKTNCKEGEVKYNGGYNKRWRLHFVPYIPVFRLTRKKERLIRSPNSRRRNDRRFIRAIEKIESVPTKCITVDSPNKMYLVTKNYIPTHNTVSGVIKTLERLRRGMSGILVSPNLPHFNRSLWPEFRRWCPWQLVVPEHRHRGSESWEAHKPFTLVIKNMYGKYSTLICGGIERPISFEGPNVHFAYVDEMRQIDDPEVIKVLTGRTRLNGPLGEPPQFYVTSTPRMHFMYDFFGPLQENDGKADFKKFAKSIILRTEDNVDFSDLDEQYVEARSTSLTEKERLARMEGEWVDEDNDTKFLESILLWDVLREDHEFVKKKGEGGFSDALVIGVDASVSNDSFAIVGVTRHPDNIKNVLVRLCRVWKPGNNGKIDYYGTPDNPGPELYLRTLAANYNVLVVVYDEYQLHDMMSRLIREGIVWCEDFSQVKARTIADHQLYTLILTKRIFHTGQEELREHIKNAGSLIDVDSRKRRMIKFSSSRKIDAGVALSMAANKCLYLNI